MAGHTAHLVDHVLPPVAVRQWVLSLPHPVRYLLAWDHELCRAVVGVFLRAVLGFLRTRAARDGIAGGRGGAVAMVQRFGAALNLNVHVHALVLDGVFSRGPSAGPGSLRADAAAPRCHARLDGFDLHAGVVAPAGHRHRLERLCRYGLRPPVAEDRLHLTADGQVLLRLRHPWTDWTTHLLFEPSELLERLAVLTPRPRVNLILYYGVLAPRAAWRTRVAPGQPAAARDGPGHPDAAAGHGHGGPAHPPDPAARS